jgi:hypothetical protein
MKELARMAAFAAAKVPSPLPTNYASYGDVTISAPILAVRAPLDL